MPSCGLLQGRVLVGTVRVLASTNIAVRSGDLVVKGAMP